MCVRGKTPNNFQWKIIKINFDYSRLIEKIEEIFSFLKMNFVKIFFIFFNILLFRSKTKIEKNPEQ